jgi:hypothetical protein
VVIDQARHTGQDRTGAGAGAGNNRLPRIGYRLTSHSVLPGLRLFSLRPSEAAASLDGLIGPISKLIKVHLRTQLARLPRRHENLLLSPDGQWY